MPQRSEFMPIYEYECTPCEKVHEIRQKFSDPLIKECPDCGAEVRKLMSLSAFALKGSGWYTSDYKRTAPKKEEAAPADGEGEQGGAVAAHECKGKNACKGQGGCGVEGQNDCKGKNPCKGKGGCKVSEEDAAKMGGDAAEGDQGDGAQANGCKGKNDCKGKGGCAVEGQNECKGKNPCKGKGGCNM